MALRALVQPGLAGVLTACASVPPPQPEPFLPLEVAEFVVQRGDSVVATERTARSLDRLEGELLMPGSARVTYTASLTGIGTVVSLQATLRPWTGPDEEAITVRLLGDTVAISSSRWNHIEQRIAAPAAAVYLHPSPALLEILLRRALLAGDSIAEVPVWLVNQNSAAIARLQQSADATWIELAGARVRLLHENGYLLAGEVPSLGWTFMRR